MKKKRFMKEKIIRILKQNEASKQSICRWLVTEGGVRA